MQEHVLQPRVLNGYQITRPVKVSMFEMTGRIMPGTHMQYFFSALQQSIGVIGSSLYEAEEEMYETLVETYKLLTRESVSMNRNAEENLVDSLAVLDMSSFISPLCLPPVGNPE